MPSRLIFDLRTESNFQNYTAKVRVLSGYIDCELANVTNHKAFLLGSPVSAGRDADGNEYTDTHDGTVIVAPEGEPKKFLTTVEPEDSGSRIDDLTLSTASCPPVALHWDQNTAHGKTDVWSVLQGYCNDTEPRFVFGFQRSDFVVCKPHLSIKTGEMSYTTQNSSIDSWSISNCSAIAQNEIENVNAWSLALGFMQGIKETNITQLMISVSPNTTLSNFKNPTTLRDAFQKLYRVSIAQIANIYLLGSEGTSFDVGSIETMNRLRLTGYGLWATQFLLVVQAILSLYMVRLLGHFTLPRSPLSITGLATVLSRSETLLKSLLGTALSNPESVKRKLGLSLCQSVVLEPSSEHASETFCIMQYPKVESDESKDVETGGEDAFSWYNPFIVTLYGRLLIIAIAVALVLALEIIWQRSDQNGFFVIFDHHSYDEYGWRFVPAAVLVLFSLLIGSLDSEVKTLQPFINFQKGHLSSKTTIDLNYHGAIGTLGVWRALKRSQYCVIATSLALILANFLTIASNGLFVAHGAFQEDPIQMVQTDAIQSQNFRRPGPVSSQVDGLMVATSVLDKNMSLPDWTYETLVIPQLELPVYSQSNKSSTEYREITATLTATRAKANCTVVDPDSYQAAVVVNSNLTETWQMQVDFNLTTPCGNLSLDPELIDGIRPVTMPVGAHGEDSAAWLDRSGRFENSTCPEYLAVALNYQRALISAVHCNPYLENVDAEVVLQYPSLKINRSTVPLIHESSRRFTTTLEIPKIGANLFSPYRDASEKLNGTLDGFFGTLQLRGVPISSLTNDSQALKSAVEELYPRVIAQVLNQNRVPTDPKLITGKLRLERRLKLTQDFASTRILQGLLTTMALCVALTFFLGDTKRILPKNPRTIAAAASLLAGSELLRSGIPPGSEWCNDQELQEKSLFEGLWFSMGWWKLKEAGVEDGETASTLSNLERFGIDVGTADKKL